MSSSGTTGTTPNRVGVGAIIVFAVVLIALGAILPYASSDADRTKNGRAAQPASRDCNIGVGQVMLSSQRGRQSIPNPCKKKIVMETDKCVLIYSVGHARPQRHCRGWPTALPDVTEYTVALDPHVGPAYVSWSVGGK